MEWLLNRRRMMYNRETTPKYLTFEGQEVWGRLCCAYGDFDETVITDNGDDTVNIVTSFVSMRYLTEVKREVISTQTNVDNTGRTYTAGTIKSPVGITMRQCEAVISFRDQLGPLLRTESLSGTETFHEFRYFTNLYIGQNANSKYTFTNGCAPNFAVTELTFPPQAQAMQSVGVWSGLKKLIINEGFLNLYSGFRGNTQEAIIDAPSTLTNMSPYVFYGTNGKITMILRAATPPTLIHSYDSSGKPKVIYVPDGSVTAYRNDADWQQWMSAAGLDINTIIQPMSNYNPS